MHDYMDFANYYNMKIDNLDVLGLTDEEIPKKVYVPVLDIFGPYFFYPPHCKPRSKDKLYESPIIGVFKNDNQVQRDVINTMRSLFRG